MNAAFQQHLREHGARIEAGTVIDFGSPEVELASADTAAVVVALGHLSALRITGADAGVFLHSLSTNDVRGLADDRAQYNGLCNAKGRMLASFLLWHDSDGYRLAVARDLGEALRRKLAIFVLRSRVALEDDTANHALIGLAGPDAVSALERAQLPVPDEPMKVARIAGGCVIRLDAARFLLSIGAHDAPGLWDRLARTARPAGERIWRRFDIDAGIAWIVAATAEQFVPQMVNFECIGGVNFHKGCYPGQEIVARSQYLGKLKRRMYRAHVEDGILPAPGTPLYSPQLPDQSCGTVIDAVTAAGGGYDLLAVIQTSCAEDGSLRLGRADGSPLHLEPLPYRADSAADRAAD